MALTGLLRYGTRNHEKIIMKEIKVIVLLTITNLRFFLDILTRNRKIVAMTMFITILNGCASERRSAAAANRGKYGEFILAKIK
jgi:hypothetical protein